MVTPVLSKTLSLIPSWSGMNASLGALSGVSVVVTHNVPSPGSGFVASQCAGRAGAVTPSKFSTQFPPGEGPTVAVAVAVGVGVPGVGVGDGVPGVGVGKGPPFPRSYTSTNPTPVPLFTPASTAV